MLHEVSVKYPACAFEVNPQNHTGIFFFFQFCRNLYTSRLFCQRLAEPASTPLHRTLRDEARVFTLVAVPAQDGWGATQMHGVE